VRTIQIQTGSAEGGNADEKVVCRGVTAGDLVPNNPSLVAGGNI